MEEKVIDRFYHEHPLVLTENVSDNNSLVCYGCGDLVTDLELAYVCTVQNCSNRIILHKKCGELPSQILNPKHPQHPIHLYDHSHHSGTGWCDICARDMDGALGYQCSSCNFDVNLTCPIISIDSIIQGKIELHHPSHPQHPLTLMRKPLFSFCCDACGTQDVEMAYICSICEFMIHMTCASLPLVLPKDRHHHHHLSLAFTFPEEHNMYISRCDVCHEILAKAWWVYFCGDCRFFAHLRCVAFTTAETTKQDSNLKRRMLI
ncbi:uncharacterized protein LOC125207951 isoform X2 [Salvia hispanica]|uniref:uncharacterized protein LOC125207951 isoform X2 n=1 Tax=Salvia hispanica TaxID=49212 RepID=UPI002009CE68|nr:uncharacterized protein LOC125207951 isoform X2 [Salvia hispanica]